MPLQWKPPLETPGVKRHEAADEATGIRVVVECDDSGSPQSWA